MEPILLKSFFIDQTGCPLASGRGSYETTLKVSGVRCQGSGDQEKRTVEYRITNNEFRRVESLRSGLKKRIDRIPSFVTCHSSLFTCYLLFGVSLLIKLAALSPEAAAYMKLQFYGTMNENRSFQKRI